MVFDHTRVGLTEDEYGLGLAGARTASRLRLSQLTGLACPLFCR
jgi:hypothetical protein